MELAKAFDGMALIEALKAKGIADAEKILTSDIIPVIFDWLNSSVPLEWPNNPYSGVALTALRALEQKILEATIAYVDQKIA